jgi:uncharacterized membrane protein YoaK (UPF0700 family)
MTSLTFEETQKQATSLQASALLAAAGGFLDGFTYVGHGHVFANAMTGNVVLLGISCFSGSWRTGLRHLPPIIAFLLGVCASEAIQLRAKLRHCNSPYTSVLWLEISVLSVLSLLPATTKDIFFTISIAFAASVQVQTFREVNGRSYSSTFTTGNLRTLGEAAFAWFFEGRRAMTAGVVRDFSVICGAFLLGAMVGGYSTQAFGNRTLWGDIALLLLVVLGMQTGIGLP